MKKEILENIFNSKRNIIIDGDMSTGKTKNIGFNFINKIINSKESMFILDSREEYLNKYYNILKNNNYNIVIINMKDCNKSEGWNLLEYPYNLYKDNQRDAAMKYLDKITKEIFVDTDNAEIDPFWLNSASDYFTGIALALFNDANPEEINLCSINSIINESTSKVNYVAEYFRTKDITDMSYVYASGTVFSPQETMGGIVSSAKQKIRPLVSKELLNKLLNKTTFNYKSILEKPSAIFFINDEGDASLNSLTSIFISQLYSILNDNKSTNKFNFVLDNFDTITYLSNLKETLSSCISNNVKLYIITRDKERLEKKYSTYINKLANTINVTEKKVIVKINTDIKEFTNATSKEHLKDSNVIYPNLINKQVNIFNLKKFVLENIKIQDEEL